MHCRFFLASDRFFCSFASIVCCMCYGAVDDAGVRRKQWTPTVVLAVVFPFKPPPSSSALRVASLFC